MRKIKLINKTKLNDKAILDMMGFADVPLKDCKQLEIIDVKECRDLLGCCIKVRKGVYKILMLEDHEDYLETLVHELHHITHFESEKKANLTREQEELNCAVYERFVRERDTTKL